MKNNKKIRKLSIMVTLLMAVMVLAGCTTFDNFKYTFIDKPSEDENTDVIYIGVYEPQTGELSDKGNAELKGIQLANKIYSNVKGARVELIIIDNQSTSKTSEDAIDNLVKLKPSIIIGSAGETPSMIASPVINKHQIVTITPSATNPMITENNPYYFRACITDRQRGAGLAEYACKGLESRKIGIIRTKNDSTATTLTDGFTENLKVLSGDEKYLVMDESIAIDGSDIDLAIKEIIKTDADIIYAPIGLEQADKLFTKIEEEHITGITFLGLASWGNPEFVNMMKKHPSIKVAFSSAQLTGSDGTTKDTITAETQRFLVEYHNTYGYEDTPSDNAFLAYDAYLLAINAINNADSLEPESIRQALRNTDNLRCTTGVFTFDDYGSPIRAVNVSTIKDGQVVGAYSTKDVAEAGRMKKIERGAE